MLTTNPSDKLYGLHAVRRKQSALKQMNGERDKWSETKFIDTKNIATHSMYTHVQDDLSNIERKTAIFRITYWPHRRRKLCKNGVCDATWWSQNCSTVCLMPRCQKETRLNLNIFLSRRQTEELAGSLLRILMKDPVTNPTRTRRDTTESWNRATKVKHFTS